MIANPYRIEMVKSYRERLLKALVKGDLQLIFLDLGLSFPNNSTLEARYHLLANWTPRIRELALEIITRNLEP